MTYKTPTDMKCSVTEMELIGVFLNNTSEMITI